MRVWKYIAAGAERPLLEAPRVGHRVELERLDPQRDIRRYYALAIVDDTQLGLFGEKGPPVLIVTLGRLGQRLRVRRERYMSPEQLAERWYELLGARRRHQYSVTAGSVAG